jgi:hypothetical protein
LVASREVVLEVKKEKTKHVFVSGYQNAGRSHKSLVAKKPFGNVAEFRYLGTTVTYHNCIHKYIKNRLNSGNAATILFSLLSSPLLCKNLNIKIYKTLILPIVFYGCETKSYHSK